MTQISEDYFTDYKNAFIKNQIANKSKQQFMTCLTRKDVEQSEHLKS
jgi:hypothetical protein